MNNQNTTILGVRPRAQDKNNTNHPFAVVVEVVVVVIVVDVTNAVAIGPEHQHPASAAACHPEDDHHLHGVRNRNDDKIDHHVANHVTAFATPIDEDNDHDNVEKMLMQIENMTVRQPAVRSRAKGLGGLP